MERGREQRRREPLSRCERGFSLTELLVVIALMGAARQVAVSTRVATSLAVDTAAGSYSWTDSKGRVRSVTLPVPVRFVAATPATITFTTNGTVTTGVATIALQNTVNGTRADRWTLDLNTVGRVTSSYSQVAP